MKRSRPARFLCLLLACATVCGLCACPMGEPATGTTGTSGSTTGSGTGGNPDDTTDAVYADAAPAHGAGAVLEEGSFALTAHTPDEANAKEANNMTALFRGKTPDAGATYILKEASKIDASGRIYDGNGAVVIAPKGIVIEGASEFTLTNITVIGPVTVKASESVIFENVDFQNPNGAAISADAESVGVLLKGCRVSGKEGFVNAANGAVVLGSYFAFTEAGVKDTAVTGTNIVNCLFEGAGVGISTTASELIVRQNTLRLAKDDKGICLTGETVNTLVALNSIKGAQQGLLIEGAFNSSVVLNEAVTVVANNNVSLYICDNSLGGRLRLSDNDYLLADGNNFPDDGLDHSTLQAGNQNINGDSLMDVDARLEVGADENLLPHINRDLFIGMEKKTVVTDYANSSFDLAATDYLMQFAKTSKYVILAPGRYSCRNRIDFNHAHSDTVIYGYGAYIERVYEQGVSSLGTQIFCSDVDKITFKGLTVGFERQSCGQVYVLDKMDANRILVVTGAGMDNEFGNTNTALYNTTVVGAQREGTFYSYCDTSFLSIRKQDNGFMEMTVDGSVYEMIAKGDILTCRALDGGRTFITYHSSDIVYKDVFVYGGACGFAFVEEGNRTATTYYRVMNTTKSGPVIDEATYNRYKALEEEYGVSLEIYVDELGRYRGSAPHIGSVDATHAIGCAQGSVAVSCLFENMCDDATNQRHDQGRLASIVDNGDGTSTVTYRGNWSVYSKTAGFASFTYPFDYAVGDRVFIYTVEGRLVCDGEALSATERPGKTDVDDVMYEFFKGDKSRGECTYEYRTVTVKTEDVNFDALRGFDLAAEGADDSQRVFVDNMSMASNGFIFDNCLMQNIRSRGLLIKASDGEIVNCTFRNIGMSCAAILYEIYWGVSGVSENLTVARNVIDHTGFFTKYTSGNEDRYSPIAIEGLGACVEEDYLLYKNIQILDNVIRNRTTEFAVYVNSARDVLIKGNDFGNHVDGESEENFTRAVHINGGMNIEISDNVYSALDLPIEEKIIAEHNKNVFGKDVEWEGESLIPDKE